MNSINIKEKNPILSSLIEEVNESKQATLITIDNNKTVVLIPLEEWSSLQ